MVQDNEKLSILYLCTGNSCRSQMAEAWTVHLKGDIFDAYSAGVNPGKIDQLAVEVMAEQGIDISGNESKGIEDFGRQDFDYVVTVCDNANETCPFFPAKTKRIHKSFDDPPKLAENEKDREKKLSLYRRVRDEIRSFVETLPEAID